MAWKTIRLAAVLLLVMVGTAVASSNANAQSAAAPAYVFVQSISVTDRVAFERYQALARDAITKYGGRFLARGANVEFLEGQGDVSTLRLLQFPSLATAKTWFTSPEYQEALKVRRVAGQQRIFVVEGLAADGK
jgi:uncharacterized protein (DUF1330 family)